MNDTKQHEVRFESEHATLKELLAIRDGEYSTKLDHVSQCSFCQARLEEVYSAAANLQSSLMFEADLPVPERVWTQLERRLREKGVSENDHQSPWSTAQPTNVVAAMSTKAKPSFWSSINAAIYSLAAAIMFTGMVSLYNSNNQNQSQFETQALQASIQNLMDSSRGLESVLQEVVTQNQSRSAGLANQSEIDRLKWQLMLVDQKINESEQTDSVSYEDVKALWGERVETLTELNKLYYSNQVAKSSGEI